jgi:hypothetical protein
MSSDDKLTALRRNRGYYIGGLTRLSKRLNEYEASGKYREGELIVLEKQLKEVRTGFEAIQQEMTHLDEEERTRGLDIADQFDALKKRIGRHLISVRQASTSTPKKCESSTDSGPISVRLPEIHLPTFDGTIKDWEAFHTYA